MIVKGMIKENLEKFLNHPEFLDFKSDSIKLLRIILRVLTFSFLLSVIVPAFFVFAQYWIPYAESKDNSNAPAIMVISMNLIYFGYIIYAGVAIAFMFKSVLVFPIFLVSYNLLVAVNYYLQTQGSIFKFETNGSPDIISYGITFLNILNVLLIFKAFRKRN